MQAFKIKVNNPEHSRQIQEAAFKLGYSWFQRTKEEIRNTGKPYLYFKSYGNITWGDSRERFKQVKCLEYILENEQFVPKETTMKDSRFPFTLSQDQAKEIVDIACPSWKSKLSTKWGKELLLNNKVVIEENFYKEMRKACTSEQHILFDSIFGQDVLKSSLPKSWEELEEIEGYWADNYSNVTSIESSLVDNCNKNIFKTKEQAKASIALAQLTQLRDVYRNGWKPNWSEYDLKWDIYKQNHDIRISSVTQLQSFLIFQSKEVAEEFLTNFKDLIEEASPLLFD